MDNYEWKQWDTARILHLVDERKSFDHYSACGLVGGYGGYIDPPVTQIKCKNCERERELKCLI